MISRTAPAVKTSLITVWRKQSIIVAIVSIGIVWNATPLLADDTPAVGTRGMVSTAHPIATRAGVETLKNGGNAFDAAVTIAATLNVVEPYNSGIGGYGLILIYHAARGETRVLNSSGRFPASVDAEVFRASTPNHRENRKRGPAISTPTNVNAWSELSSNYGMLEWATLFESAIGTAENGFPVSKRTASVIAKYFDEFPRHAKAFYGRDGRPLAEGEKLVQRDLAGSLRLLAAEGPAALYGGELGEAIVAGVRDAGGFVSMADLAKNRAEWWEPISIRYRGYEVVTASPPANSFSSLLRLRMMSNFDVASLGHNTADYLHRFAEVSKHAFWCRLKYAGDPDVSPPPLDLLLGESYGRDQVARLDMRRAISFVPPSPVPEAGAETTHFVVADSEGNIVCATQTIGTGFGSKVMPPGTGVWMNNSMNFCTFDPPGNPMDAHPGRRKLISNHPTFVMRDGKPWIAIGTPGGHTIGQTVPQMIMGAIDFDMDIQQAIAAPRVSFVEPDQLSIEAGIDQSVRSELAAKGHKLKEAKSIGNAHGLTIEYGTGGKPQRFTGGADPRGQGEARGY